MAEKRHLKPEPERTKRGRWVLPVVLVITVFVGLYFWMAG